MAIDLNNLKDTNASLERSLEKHFNPTHQAMLEEFRKMLKAKKEKLRKSLSKFPSE